MRLYDKVVSLARKYLLPTFGLSCKKCRFQRHSGGCTAPFAGLHKILENRLRGMLMYPIYHAFVQLCTFTSSHQCIVRHSAAAESMFRFVSLLDQCQPLLFLGEYRAEQKLPDFTQPCINSFALQAENVACMLYSFPLFYRLLYSKICRTLILLPTAQN